MRVYSPTFDYLYDIKTFQRTQTVRKYLGKSMLTLVIAASDDAAHYLQKNSWIVDEEPFIIKHIVQGLNEITITAYGGHQLLTQRITVPTTYAIEYTGSADAVVKHFINQSKRSLPLSTAAVQGGSSIRDQSRFKNLGDEVVRVLTGAGRGEKFEIVGTEIVFDTFAGTDRSKGNAADTPPVIFDLRYKNLSDYSYTEDSTVEQTTVYVGGAGEGVDREIGVTGNDVAGIDRVEVFVDARDVALGDTGMLAERAAQSTINTVYTVSAAAVADANLVYGVDYELGDIVTTNVPVKTYEAVGAYYDPVDSVIQVNQRITEVVITRENGTEDIDLTFGEQPITQTQVQRLRAEVAQLKSVEGTSIDLPVAISDGGTGEVTAPEAYVALGGTNPNLLDNWYFPRPVNQRQVSGTISAAGYFVDRWKLVSGTVTLTSNGLTLNGSIAQILEFAAGVNVTASVSMHSGTATIGYNNSNKTVTITSSGGTLSAAKLELGVISTLVNDAPPNYMEQYLRCAPYLFAPVGRQYGHFGIVVATGANDGYAYLPMPVPLRSSIPASVVFNGFYAANSTRPLTLIAVRADGCTLFVQISTTGTLTNGMAYDLSASSSTPSIIISCEP